MYFKKLLLQIHFFSRLLPPYKILVVKHPKYINSIEDKHWKLIPSLKSLKYHGSFLFISFTKFPPNLKSCKENIFKQTFISIYRLSFYQKTISNEIKQKLLIFLYLFEWLKLSSWDKSISKSFTSIDIDSFNFILTIFSSRSSYRNKNIFLQLIYNLDRFPSKCRLI